MFSCVTLFYVKKDWAIKVVDIDVNYDGDAFPEVGDLVMILMLFQLMHYKERFGQKFKQFQKISFYIYKDSQRLCIFLKFCLF